ncbi:MAG: glycosyltransferase family 61 protein [Promicromonosporaceae bacterium]|nr:glycosyltransferase family 61 protein [Promicromonosporaceae bacterium]
MRNLIRRRPATRIDEEQRLIQLQADGDTDQLDNWLTARTPRINVFEHTGAYLTPASTVKWNDGPLPVGTKPDPHNLQYSFHGAAYTLSGDLIPESQRRVTGPWFDVVRSDNPTVLGRDTLSQLDRDSERLSGRWIYGGTFFNHFGHFILESLTTLWLPVEDAGIIWHPLFAERQFLDVFEQALVDLLGWGNSEMKFATHPLRVERLIVPERPVAVNRFVEPEALKVWDTVAEAAPKSNGPYPEKMFLSRTRFQHDAFPVANDQQLDQAMESLGFSVIHPQELPVAQQIALARGAKVISGVQGSAMHVAAFARNGTHIIEFDRQESTNPNGTQLAIAAAREQPFAFIRCVGRDESGAVNRDIGKAIATVKKLMSRRAFHSAPEFTVIPVTAVPYEFALRAKAGRHIE